VALGDKTRERRQRTELAAWLADRERLLAFIARAETFTGASNDEVPALPLQLDEGERALLVLPGVELVEPRRLPGHFMGGNAGFSFPVALSTGRPGPSADHDPAAIDSGVITLTDRRAVFGGSLHFRTWDYGEVVGFHHNGQPPWTAIAVSDRQQASGVRYDAAHAEEFRFALVLGLARRHGSADSLTADLRRQLDDLERARPAGMPVAQPAPAASGAMSSGAMSSGAMSSAGVGSGEQAGAPSGGPPPGWYPDPYRTARLRWWDGRTWTSHAAP
jgi:hypothetical protein